MLSRVVRYLGHNVLGLLCNWTSANIDGGITHFNLLASTASAMASPRRTSSGISTETIRLDGGF